MNKKTLSIVLVLVGAVAMSGCITKDNATAYGYILDVEPEVGLIWKTPVIYVKTDDTSSLRDQYCLDAQDSNVNKILADAIKYADSKQRVEIKYYDNALQAPWRTHMCEDGIITAITKSSK